MKCCCVCTRFRIAACFGGLRFILTTITALVGPYKLKGKEKDDMLRANLDHYKSFPKAAMSL